MNEKIVGKFEPALLIDCPNCNSQNVFAQKFLIDPDYGVTSFKCRACGCCELGDIKQGIRFDCPHCKFYNVQIVEPTEIATTESGNKITFYQTDEVSCMRCEQTFGASIYVKETGDGLHTWNFSLSSKE